MPKEEENEDGDGGEGGEDGEEGEEEGGGGGEEGEGGGGGGKWREMDDHSWIHDATQKEIEAAEKAYEGAKDKLPDEVTDIRNDQPVGGSFGSGASTDIQRKLKVSFSKVRKSFMKSSLT